MTATRGRALVLPRDLWDDQRFERAGLRATGTWFLAACWSSRQRMDGFIPAPVVHRFVGKSAGERAAAALAAERIWRPVSGGWFHPGWRALHGQYRPNIRPGTRIAVYVRDGWTCQECHRVIPPMTAGDRCGRTAPLAADGTALTLDHLTPFSEGGPDTVVNLRSLCGPCNTARGTAALLPALEVP